METLLICSGLHYTCLTTSQPWETTAGCAGRRAPLRAQVGLAPGVPTQQCGGESHPMLSPHAALTRNTALSWFSWALLVVRYQPRRLQPWLGVRAARRKFLGHATRSKAASTDICQVSQIFDIWHTALAGVVTLQNILFFPVHTAAFTLSLAASDIRHRGNRVGSQLSVQWCRNTMAKKCRTINFFGLVGFEAPVSRWKNCHQEPLEGLLRTPTNPRTLEQQWQK